jgi:hypothetical protein
MIIETKIDLKSYSKLMLILSYKRPTTIVLTGIGVLLLISSLLYFAGINLFFDEPPYFQIYLGILIIVYFPAMGSIKAKQNFIAYHLLQEKIIYEFTEEGFMETGETFDSDMEWTEVYRILELNNWIIIYHATGSANFIPKAAFGNRLAEFKNLVKDKELELLFKHPIN